MVMLVSEFDEKRLHDLVDTIQAARTREFSKDPRVKDLRSAHVDLAREVLGKVITRLQDNGPSEIGSRVLELTVGEQPIPTMKLDITPGGMRQATSMPDLQPGKTLNLAFVLMYRNLQLQQEFMYGSSVYVSLGSVARTLYEWGRLKIRSTADHHGVSDSSSKRVGTVVRLGDFSEPEV